MKRSQGKKDHFVFGLSGSPSKGGGEVKGKFEAFKDFLWKVNFSNGLYVRIPDELDSPYKVFVGRGNNSLLVKGIIRRRPWWQLVDKITDDTNFVWTQLKVNDFFALQKKYDKR